MTEKKEAIPEKAEKIAEATVYDEDPTQKTKLAEEANEHAPAKLEKMQAEVAEMQSRYLRAVADMENYRKRIAREKQEIIRSAAADVIESLLPVTRQHEARAASS